MAVFVESIESLPGQSLRLLSWEEGVERVHIHTEIGQHRAIDGKGALWHRHPEVELTLIRCGEGLRLVGDRLGRFSDGDAVMIGRNLPHYWRMQTPGSGYCLQFDPRAPNGIWRSPEAGHLLPFWRRCERGLHLRGSLAKSLHAEVRTFPGMSPLARLGRVTGMLALIAGSPDKEVVPLASADFRLPEPGEPYDEAIAFAVNLITTRYQESLRLDELLPRLPLSRATFARHFKRSTGKTFSGFLTEVRIDHACHALVNTTLSVTDIAYESGFNDLPHFNRTFLRRTRKNPLRWRKEHADQPGGGSPSE